MKKNTKYIIGLISIICISVFISEYTTIKKEGYVTNSCVDLTNMVNSLLSVVNQNRIIDINTNGIDYNTIHEYADTPLLFQIVQFFIFMDTFNLLLQKNPNFFIDIFENTNLTDIDFNVLYKSYDTILFSLHNIRMIIININIDPKMKTQSRIPICKNINIDIKQWNNEYYNNANKYVNTIRKILDNIKNKNNNVSSNDNSFQNYIDQFTDVYNSIINIKNCSDVMFRNLSPNIQAIIYPLLDLVSIYVSNCIQTINKHFVPALNAKLKDGQKIKIQETVYKPPQSQDTSKSSVPNTPLTGGSTLNTTALISGIGSTTS